MTSPRHDPDTAGMVSSLWVLADSVGGYLGDSLGSLAYDRLGFPLGCVVMEAVMGLALAACCVLLLRPVSRSSAEEERRLLLPS